MGGNLNGFLPSTLLPFKDALQCGTHETRTSRLS